MDKAYVRFGEIDNPKHTRVYEGIVTGNEVQLLMPKTSHSGARDILESLGFGDVKTYIVEGEIQTIDDKGKVFLTNTKVVKELFYNPSLEKFYLNKEIDVLDRYKITDETSDKDRIKIALKEYRRLWKKMIQDNKNEGRQAFNSIKGIKGFKT